MAKHNEIGKQGEELAAEMLTAKGYAIMERNCKIGHYELDIVAQKGDRIVFVEVKTRTDADDDPLDAINRQKIAYLCRAANKYMQESKLPHEVQFDVITVSGGIDGNQPPVVEHYPDAFRPPLSSGRARGATTKSIKDVKEFGS